MCAIPKKKLSRLQARKRSKELKTSSSLLAGVAAQKCVSSYF
jgi:hypothetical protein